MHRWRFLGVKIAPETDSTTLLSLYYSDVTTDVTSQVIANFTVPKFAYKWTQFAFRVTLDDVTLFFNCTETETVKITKKLRKLSFESACTLYLAQAGPVIGGVFEVSFLPFNFCVSSQICTKAEKVWQKTIDESSYVVYFETKTVKKVIHNLA